MSLLVCYYVGSLDRDKNQRVFLHSVTKSYTGQRKYFPTSVQSKCLHSYGGISNFLSWYSDMCGKTSQKWGMHILSLFRV